MLNRGVFLDRDGTINDEVHYLSQPQQFKLIKGAAEAINLLNQAGFKVVVFTNQSAVARGFLSEARLQAIHQLMADRLRAQGAYLDGIYYCPHHPTAGVGPYKVACHCRKPKPGMLERAARELAIDLGQSFVVGDTMSDLEAGYAAGCRNILVRTGYGLEQEALFNGHHFQPDYVAEDLWAATEWIIWRKILRTA
jgi:D-glycero-D-manno-heptose 1,7-bisphosphate phosphatase